LVLESAALLVSFQPVFNLKMGVFTRFHDVQHVISRQPNPPWRRYFTIV
jgi:hypothetical protein